MISIIIPVYNTDKKFIDECINSIARQTYKDFETIIVDDGSNKETADYCDKLALEFDFLRIIHIENHGVSYARNTGKQAAKGEYFTFIDSDDFIEPEYLEVLYNNIINNDADISVVYSNICRNDKLEKSNLDNKIFVWDNKTMVKKALEDHPSGYTAWGKLYSAEKFKDVFFVEDAKIHEDSFFAFECFVRADNVVIQNIGIYNYRVLLNSASRSKYSDKFLSIIELAKRKTEITRKLYPEYYDLSKNMVLRGYIAIFNVICYSGYKNYKTDFKMIHLKIREYSKYYVSLGTKDRILFNLLLKCPWLYANILTTVSYLKGTIANG